MEALPKFCRAVHQFELPVLSEIVLLVERSPPPERPVPAEMVVAGAT